MNANKLSTVSLVNEEITGRAIHCTFASLLAHLTRQLVR